MSALKAVRRPIRRGTNLVAALTAVTTDGDWTRYRWTKVPVLHAATTDSHAGTNECSGDIHTYVYRHYPRESEVFHRRTGVVFGLPILVLGPGTPPRRSATKEKPMALLA